MPQPMDPSVALMSAGADPQDVLDAMRQAQLAQTLTQGAITPPTVQNYGAARSRISPISGLSKMAEALLARRAFSQAAQAQGNVYGQAGQSFQGPQMTPVPQGAGQGGAPGVPGAPQQYQYTPAGRNYIPGVDPRVGLATLMSDPAKFAEMQQGPDWLQAARRAGMPEPQAAAQHFLKENAASFRPGQTVSYNGDTYMIPDPGRGEFYRLNQGGNWEAVPIEKSAEIAAHMAGTVTQAQQEATPTRVQEALHPDVTLFNYQHPRQPGNFSPIPAGQFQGAPGAPPPAPGVPPVGLPQPPAGGAGGPPPAAQGMPPPGLQPHPAVTGAMQPHPAVPGAVRPQTPPNPYGPQGPSVGDVASIKAGGNDTNDLAQKLNESAQDATEVRRSLAELRNLSAAAPPSALNEKKLQLGGMMYAMGFPPTWLAAHGFSANEIGALSAAQKQTGNLAVNSIRGMTSRGTTYELQTFMKQNPNLNMANPEAFQRVDQFIDSKMQNEIAKQGRYSDFLSSIGRGHPPSQFMKTELTRDNADIDAGKYTSQVNAPPQFTRQSGGKTYYSADGKSWFDNPGLK